MGISATLLFIHLFPRIEYILSKTWPSQQGRRRGHTVPQVTGSMRSKTIAHTDKCLGTRNRKPKWWNTEGEEQGCRVRRASDQSQHGGFQGLTKFDRLSAMRRPDPHGVQVDPIRLGGNREVSKRRGRLSIKIALGRGRSWRNAGKESMLSDEHAV
jgi:hypothetical protein